ncbi:unnamed protein product [Effrenium voratum]|nr:unnamed protein product [Effrenium voratum]
MLDRPLDFAVNCLFYVDLFLNFFISYKDAKGVEVVDLRQTSTYYLRTYFLPNLVACIPPQLLEAMLSADVHTDILEVARFTRLQRMSRLARLVRLIQLSKLIRFLDESPMVVNFRNLRGVRIINLFCMLSWVAHMICCGWYLVAALNTHTPYEDTWLGMRISDSSGGNLLYRGDGTEVSPQAQWLHSFYFVLTVFTTVGFGDMSAFTAPELVYLCGTMLLGAIVNSVILNEVITTLTRLDESATRVMQQMQVVADFSEHCNLDRPLRKQLVRWARESRADKHDWDREWMREILTNGRMPSRLVHQLPSALFSGRLMSNRFLTVCRGKFRHGLPPRFYMILALHLEVLDFERKQVVYHCNDQAFSIYLVLKGVFANIALPSPDGGVIEKTDFMRGLDPKTKTRLKRQSTSDFLRRRVEQNDEALQLRMDRLSPYQLFCEGSYFGDVEVMAFPPEQRRSSVRCEHDGKLLQLHRDKLDRLLQDFPRCMRTWQAKAGQHEAQRKSKLKQLVEPLDFFELASRDIQRAVVNIWRHKGSKSSLSSKGSKNSNNSSGTNGSDTKVAQAVSPVSEEDMTWSRSLRDTDADSTLRQEVQEVKGRLSDMSRQMLQLKGGMVHMQESLAEVVSLLTKKGRPGQDPVSTL